MKQFISAFALVFLFFSCSSKKESEISLAPSPFGLSGAVLAKVIVGAVMPMLD
jgi:hypothetical protein